MKLIDSPTDPTLTRAQRARLLAGLPIDADSHAITAWLASNDRNACFFDVTGEEIDRYAGGSDWMLAVHWSDDYTAEDCLIDVVEAA